MPHFSDKSLKKLSRVHPDLVKVFSEVVKRYDCTILEGWRSHEDQQKYLEQGKSTKGPGESFHNGWTQTAQGLWKADPNGISLAVDVSPYPIIWEDIPRFDRFAHYALGVADGLKISITWGGDWNRNWDLKDQKFNDKPHFELANVYKL